MHVSTCLSFTLYTVLTLLITGSLTTERIVYTVIALVLCGVHVRFVCLLVICQWFTSGFLFTHLQYWHGSNAKTIYLLKEICIPTRHYFSGYVFLSPDLTINIFMLTTLPRLLSQNHSGDLLWLDTFITPLSPFSPRRTPHPPPPSPTTHTTPPCTPLPSTHAVSLSYGKHLPLYCYLW